MITLFFLIEPSFGQEFEIRIGRKKPSSSLPSSPKNVYADINKSLNAGNYNIA
jgi:hypothetical protein